MLRPLTKPIDVIQLSSAKCRSCFPVVSKPTYNLSAPQQRVLLQKITKNDWEILDEYVASLLDTVTIVVGEVGLWYCHASLNDYESAVVLNHDNITAHHEKELSLAKSPNRK